eukprot:ctg_1093.g454
MGTGHGIYLARDALPPDYDGHLVVLYADNPGVDASLLQQLLAAHRDNERRYGRDRYGALILTGSRRVAQSPGAAHYGRIVRGDADGGAASASGPVVDIVEKRQIDRLPADDPRRHRLDAIDEYNSGIVVARAQPYWRALGQARASPVSSGSYEYYATDFVKHMVSAGRVVQGWQIPADEQYKLEGVNTVEELQTLERKLDQRTRG